MSEIGLICMQIGRFLVRREPLLRGSEPRSIGVGRGATVARVAVVVAAYFRERVTPETGCIVYLPSMWKGDLALPAPGGLSLRRRAFSV